MARSILGMVGLGTTLVFAIPVALLGLEFLLARGQPTVGAGLLVAAGLMIAIEEHVTTPDDLAGKALDKTVGTVVKSPDDEEE
ncbi:hypothetical protein C475_07921 [Halosimplex carlsbadense 2-9-1]|uniref:Uncharacterized protein n=1 Tax=Halosimplex carlsbadense 2-9-1 TaxID=797114 RepID=M0CUC0_9EURY|nr:hypothetical protein [Halosimplex carlsbadense]ELZ26845.1 hypothetical protein C475_07921 [Halosimplex carlsbadense 2-9-1]